MLSRDEDDEAATRIIQRCPIAHGHGRHWNSLCVCCSWSNWGSAPDAAIFVITVVISSKQTCHRVLTAASVDLSATYRVTGAPGPLPPTVRMTGCRVRAAATVQGNKYGVNSCSCI